MSLVYFILCSVISKGGRDKEEVIFYLVLSVDEIVACERHGIMLFVISVFFFVSICKHLVMWFIIGLKEPNFILQLYKQGIFTKINDYLTTLNFIMYLRMAVFTHKPRKNKIYDSGTEKQFNTKYNRTINNKNYTFERVENFKYLGVILHEDNNHHIDL